MKHYPWQVLARDSLVIVRPWLQLWRESVQLPNGQVIDDYYTIDMQDFSMVAAFTPQCLLVVERCYKHGAQQVTYTLPAGIIEAGESPLLAAQRELLEETGFSGGTWQPSGTFIVSDTRGCGHAHLFIAKNIEPIADPLNNDLEQIEMILMTPKQFYQIIIKEQRVELSVVTAFSLACWKLGIVLCP